MDYKEESDNRYSSKESEKVATEGESCEEIDEREREISANIEIIQEKLFQFRDSVNPNVLFDNITTIFNMLSEKYGKEYIEFLINVNFFDIIFQKINVPGSFSDNILLSSLQLINKVLSSIPKNTISKAPISEYYTFLFDKIKKDKFSSFVSFLWNALGVLIKSDDFALNKMIDENGIEELQRIVEKMMRKLTHRDPVYYTKNDDDVEFDEGSMSEEEDNEINDTTLSTIWHYLMKCFYNVIEGIFATMNDESRKFYVGVCICALVLPHIPSAQKIGLKALLYMSDINPGMIIEMIHNKENAIDSIFATQNQKDQEIVELGIHLIYKLINFAPDAFNIEDVAKYVFNVIEKFGWSEATNQFEWATKIISRLCEIPELQKTIIPESLLLDADNEIGDASYDIKRILVNMLCHIFIHGTKETKDRLLNIYNFVASICDATSNIEQDNEDADLIVLAIAEITKEYVLIGWNIISIEDFCDLVDRDFIEEKSESACESSEAAKYIMSILDGD